MKQWQRKILRTWWEHLVENKSEEREKNVSSMRQDGYIRKDEGRYTEKAKRWHGIMSLLGWEVLSMRRSWWPHNLYFSRMKNLHGHWACLMSAAWKNGLMRETHTDSAAVPRYSCFIKVMAGWLWWLWCVDAACGSYWYIYIVCSSRLYYTRYFEV